MGFSVTTLIFAMVGLIASLSTRICFNRGPSANLLHLTLVMTATVCCWMIVEVRSMYILPSRDTALRVESNGWAIVYLAQMNPLIVPILSEGE